ncbi:MAG TPA: winged helix DNA-binding domain-containing protein [Dermatophilaceae bacterium]|nr:winged helix DNA-binding domain-containing protein [Dermatophilaceae bacterium]
MKASDRRRLRRARLSALGIAPSLGTRRSPAGALEAVRELGALQAQDYDSGMWSLGVRTGLTLAQVERAVLDREVVRTWPMRGTLHLVPAEDARWMCRLLAGRSLTGMGARYRELGITDDVVALAGRVLDRELTEPMSRPDVIALLASHGIDPTGQRAYHLVGHHCMTGLLCQGPLSGRQPTFVRIDSWVPHSREPSREEAMRTVVERYVRSHGPVTEKDVAGWLAQSLTFVREALEALGDRVVREEVDGLTWLTHIDARPPARPGQLQLLPQWDEFLLGYKTREVCLPSQHFDRVVPGRNMAFQPTVVADGEVCGIWRRRRSRASTILAVELFDPAGDARWAAIVRAAAAYGRFLGQPVEVVDAIGGRP